MSIFAKACSMSAYSAPDAAPDCVPAKTYFFLSGDAGADLLPRLLLPFTKLGLAPYRVHASSEQGTGEEMSVELRFAALPRRTGEQLAARWRAMIGVRCVMTVAEG
jgi:hypothetical protein